MSKMHFEYYDGKYCKIPSNLYAEPISPNHKLEYWVFRNKDTNKYLKCVESELGIPSYSFTADSHKDEDIVCVVPGAIGLSNMLESSEDPEEVTLEYLGKDNVELVPYFKEIMWVKIDGKKVYNDNRSTWDKFCISALDNVPEVIPPGKVWDGYYMGDTKVDGMFVFEEWMAGCNIESRFHDEVTVDIVYVDGRAKEIDRITRKVKYGSEITVYIPYENSEYFTGGNVYKDENCLVKCDEIIYPTENTTVYIKVTKIHKITLLNNKVGFRRYDYVMDGDSYGEFPKGDAPSLFAFNYEGLYQDEEFCNKYSVPMMIFNDKTFYVNFVRDEEMTLEISGKEFVGYYDKDSDSYFIELMDVDPTFVGLHISIIFDEVFIKPGRVLGEEYTVLKIPANYKHCIITPQFAAPIKWRILPTYVADGRLIPYVNPIEVDIPYSNIAGSYYAPISLPKFEYGDFEEPDSHVALSGRVFMDNTCTRNVVSPEIVGNSVYASYSSLRRTTLPMCYLKVDRKPTMTPRITDVGSGDIEPKEFIVGTDQTLKLNKEMFTITNPEGKVFEKFSYTNPYTKKEHEFKLPFELKVEWSYQLMAHWTDPVKATLIVDEEDRSKDIVFTSDNAEELEFTIPNITPTKEGYFFVGWSGLPDIGEQFTITESQEFYPIWEPEDHKPVPLEEV